VFGFIMIHDLWVQFWDCDFQALADGLFPIHSHCVSFLLFN
jgi:hypothetical protein